MDELTLLAQATTKALGYTENGGKPDINNPKAGKSGEAKSIFQFTPATWKAYSKQIIGKDNLPLTSDNETYVVNEKMKQLIKEGKTIKQIASIWNAGPGEQDAYTGKFSDGSSSVGVNKKYGVKFDVPSYANQVATYAKKFYDQAKSADSNQLTMNQEPQNTQIPGIKNVQVSNVKDTNPQNQTQLPKQGLVSLNNPARNLISSLLPQGAPPLK